MSEQRILYLTLRKEFFDAILSGEKKTEYRDYTDYWDTRLCQSKKYTHVTFINGYQPTSRRMTLELKSIRLVGRSAKRPECFHIKLGKLLTTKFC